MYTEVPEEEAPSKMDLDVFKMMDFPFDLEMK